MDFHLLPTSVCEIKDHAISSDLNLIPFSCSKNNAWLTEFASIFARLYLDVYDIYNTVQRIKTFEMCKQQECIPVGCVSPALYRTGGSLSGKFSVQGVLVQMGLCQGDHSEGTWDQAAGQKVTSYRDPPAMDRMTDARL